MVRGIMTMAVSSVTENQMAKASKKHMGAGLQGKSDGTGAMTESTGDLPENMILSNRDKAQHSADRGQDGKWIQTEQMHDHELNQQKK
jgi:hypothetical protein